MHFTSHLYKLLVGIVFVGFVFLVTNRAQAITAIDVNSCTAPETATLEADATTVAPSTTVTLTGKGWTPGTVASLSINGKQYATIIGIPTEVGADGTFIHQFTATNKPDRMLVGATCGRFSTPSITINVVADAVPAASVSTTTHPFPWWLLLIILLLIVLIWWWYRHTRKRQEN